MFVTFWSTELLKLKEMLEFKIVKGAGQKGKSDWIR